MKVYISGRISGDQNYHQKFEVTQNLLQGRGHTVLNPAILPAGLTASEYMRINLAMIDTASAVVFLDDWRESPGARLERQWCEYTCKPMFDGLGDFEAAIKRWRHTSPTKL